MFELAPLARNYPLISIFNSGENTLDQLNSVKHKVSDLLFFEITKENINDLDTIAIEENTDNGCNQNLVTIKESDMAIIVLDLDDDLEVYNAILIAGHLLGNNILTVAVGLTKSRYDTFICDRLSSPIINKIKAVDTFLILSTHYDESLFNTELENKSKLLHNAIFGLTHIAIKPGLLRADFADIRSVLSRGGIAKMGVGVGSGKDRELKAVNESIKTLTGNKGNYLLQANNALVTINNAPRDSSISEFEGIYDIFNSNTSEYSGGVIQMLFEEDECNELKIITICTGEY